MTRAALRDRFHALVSHGRGKEVGLDERRPRWPIGRGGGAAPPIRRSRFMNMQREGRVGRRSRVKFGVGCGSASALPLLCCCGVWGVAWSSWRLAGAGLGWAGLGLGSCCVLSHPPSMMRGSAVRRGCSLKALRRSAGGSISLEKAGGSGQPMPPRRWGQGTRW